jgi:glucoamylase
MLPEQVWDHEDLPSQGMYEGRSAGSAQPLVWAHAEYLKLLRSVVDGKIFDTVSVVAERYAVPPGTRTFLSTIDIFQLSRPIVQIKAGWTLRIADANRFSVTYTFDNWQTTLQAGSRVVGYPGSYADIPTAGHEAGASLIFTLYWPATATSGEHWLGRNLEVKLGEHDAQFAPPLESKPGS